MAVSILAPFWFYNKKNILIVSCHTTEFTTKRTVPYFAFFAVGKSTIAPNQTDYYYIKSTIAPAKLGQTDYRYIIL